MTKRKIVIAVTGASGAIYAKVLLQKLAGIKEQWEECGLVFSSNAKEVWLQELGELNYAKDLFTVYEKDDFYAPFASGSAQYDTMIVCPCSMGTLARVAHGISDDLITRAADVILKENKKLILVPRETPFSQIHLKNMLDLSQAGALICPAIPSFYHHPESFEELAATVVDRVLHLANFEIDSRSWGED